MKRLRGFIGKGGTADADMALGGRTAFFLNAALLIVVVAWTIPVFALVVSTVRASGDINTTGWWHIFGGGGLTLDNYKIVLLNGGLPRAFLNSVLISLPSTFFTVCLAALAAYPLAHYDFPGKIFLFVAFLTLQVIPIQTTLIPVLGLLSTLHLAGTYPGVWLAHTAYGLPLSIYLFRNFFAGIPRSLLESAQIDGAGRGTIFVRIILPLSVPAIAAVGVFQFLWVWSDLLVSLVYLGGSPRVAPLTVKITGMMGSLESARHIVITAAFISMIVPLAVFLFLQKYFVKGILAGSLKE